ncbi:MAG: phosphoribosylglycinamide formyltransferase [Pseudomonadota bacterium]
MNRLRLAIMISGRGSNMEAILDAAKARNYPADPVLVLSNKPDAAGLRVAEARGIPAVVFDHKGYGADRQAYEQVLDEALNRARIEMIALAGFMRILTPWFVGRWEGRMVNIHPSLLPKYPGLDTHARAIDAGDAEHGCSVHWVTEGVDSGDVIDQARIQIQPDDTPASLSSRLLPIEHDLYPKALAKACYALADT